MPVEIKASQGAQGVTVNVMAHTVSGYDRFRNLGVPVYLNERASTSTASTAAHRGNLYNQLDGLDGPE